MRPEGAEEQGALGGVGVSMMGCAGGCGGVGAWMLPRKHDGVCWAVGGVGGPDAAPILPHCVLKASQGMGCMALISAEERTEASR